MKNFTMLINADHVISHIQPEVYGHFSEHLGRCIYNGIYVGEDSPIPNVRGIRTDIVEAFKNIRLPVLRWPGGCFADEYHWKDGIGPKDQRKKMINTNWGGVVEDNSFGTHEFMDFCEQVGCEPYIAGNVGSGTVQELSEWVEYLTFDGMSPMADLRRKNGREDPWKLKYLGIGNENWGCGGNMTPEYYANVYRQYRSFCKNYSGNELYHIACGPNGDNYNWTEVMMKNLNVPGWWTAKGLSLHYYCVPDWNHKGFALEFDEDGYYEILQSAGYIEKLVQNHSAIMDRYDPDCQVALIVDEWGTWFDVEPGTNPGFLYQQNSMRDAMVAALTLNIFNRNSRRVKMANLAQAVNVLQALVLTEGERMLLTPTYHVFDLFKEHQDADCVYCYAPNETLSRGVPMLSSSASVKGDRLTLTVANLSLTEEATIIADIHGFNASGASARILKSEGSDPHAHNTFDQPQQVKPIPHPTRLENGSLTVQLPPCSVAEISLTK